MGLVEQSSAHATVFCGVIQWAFMHGHVSVTSKTLFVTDENTDEKRRCGGAERSDIMPLNLIDSIWQRFPPHKLHKPLRPSVKETLYYSQIL